MMTTAERLVHEMGLANNCKFKPTQLQILQLENAVISCAADGLDFNDENIDLITDGDQEEADKKFIVYPDYATLRKILGEIFDGEIERTYR